ncbi:hypothetical protein [uncultured Microbacterium sp.]|uniref:hypothetical protein n=1 Tax=uncultured Microbacterium sp. TaxID=191216 RepID=UPI0026228372|nr:hypothetical protein [uncultured Microbacterium sp.]
MSAPALLIDSAGIARLAAVRRPVVSVWRARFAQSEDPFPAPRRTASGRALFDAAEVAQWLVRTEHGNNLDVIADAAAAAAPLGFDSSDPQQIAAVDALLVLRALTGEPVGGASLDRLADKARAADPEDLCLVREIGAADAASATWADALADAAYSTLDGARVLERRHAASGAVGGSRGPLSGLGERMLVALAAALGVDRSRVAFATGVAPDLAMRILDAIGSEPDVLVDSDDDAGRALRRRALLSGRVVEPGDTADGDLIVSRFPTPAASNAADVLRAIDELSLGLAPDTRAVVVAPASVLTDALVSADDRHRSAILRAGTVRAIVRLEPGLVTSAPRERLAVWVLTPPPVSPIGERYTALVDLTDAPLTSATIGDLVSDVVAALGTARDVRAHAFRFTRIVRTASLLATRGSLLGADSRAGLPASISLGELPARIDHARAALGVETAEVAPASAPPLALRSVEALIADRHLRLLAGTRIDPASTSSEGLVVVTADDLDRPAAIGERRIDPLLLATRHPSAQLTEPGDIVFRTSPSPRAWVDPDGSKVVAAPARVLRVRSADAGGLVPELIAADIDESRGGPGAWRRWMLRRVAPRERAPLRATLGALAAERDALLRRAAALDDYARLLTAGVSAGAVTLADAAAPASTAN